MALVVQPSVKGVGRESMMRAVSGEVRAMALIVEAMCEVVTCEG